MDQLFKAYKWMGLIMIMLILCISATTTKAQSAESITPLTIGDKVPDVVLKNMLFYKDSTANISDFKGKLLILDFMSVFCLSCMKALPRIDSLQKRYGDKIQVLLITPNKKEGIEDAFKRTKLADKLNLPIVPRGSDLKKYYSHKIISHIVWIDQSGITKAITHSDYIQAKNIESMLKNSRVDWPVKKDIMR